MLRAWCLALVLALAPAAKAAPPAEDAAEGVVILRLVTNTPALSRNFYRFRDVWLKREDGKQRLMTLSSVSEGIQVFAARAEPGRYRIDRFYNDTFTGAAKVSLTLDVDAMLAGFEVKAGRIVDLGAVIVQPLGDRKFGLLQEPAHPGDAAETLKFRFPALAAAADGQAAEIWNSTASTVNTIADILETGDKDPVDAAARIDLATTWLQSAQAERLAKAKALTTRFGRPYVTPDGAFYSGSPLGQVLKRAPSGAWSSLDTGLLSDIGAVYVEGGRIFAGAEDGVLLASGDGGAHFSLLTRMPDRGQVMVIAPIGAAGYAIATQWIDGKSVKTNIYFVRALGDAPNQPVRAFVEPISSPAADVVALPERLIVQAWPEGQFVFDVASQAWRAEKASAPPRRLLPSSDGRRVHTELKNPLLSRDGGATYAAYTSPVESATVLFLSDEHGLALNFHPRPFGYDEQFFESLDGGRSWRQVLKRNHLHGCVTFADNGATGQAYCMMFDGSIQATKDGANWIVERRGP
jgi:hypothetical protein